MCACRSSWLTCPKPRRLRSSRRRSSALACRRLPATFRGKLSGEMKRRAPPPRALATRPNLLLMEEPFGALDEFTRNKLDADLIRLWWERKLTTVFVTHSIYEAVFLSTRIIVMAANPGRIFRTMTIDEL